MTQAELMPSEVEGERGMPATMCDLAMRLPFVIGTLLDQEAKLKRGRFREETMTDILTGALAAFAGPNLVIQYPPESLTGGDLDLHFWHVTSGKNLYLRIQAKRLNAATNGGKSVKIAHRAYNELLHRPSTASDYQFRTLCKSPAPWLPLYMFYNHHHVTFDHHFSGDKPTVSGINLAFANDIGQELEAKLAAAAAKPKSVKHHKRLSYLRKHFFGLEAIFCPGGDWLGETVPPPDVVSESLRQRYLSWGDGTARPREEDAVFRYLTEPSEVLASYGGARMADGPAIRSNQDVEHPTVTFISGATDDGRTPIITQNLSVDGGRG